MILPNHRVSLQDRDDFVRNLVTILDVDPDLIPPWLSSSPPEPTPLSESAAAGEAVVTLAEIKLHCRIEADFTAEDDYLQMLEQAARIHTEKALRRPGQLDDTAPENVKLAMLVLIAHWYRNREAVAEGTMTPVPMTYDALISPEREYAEGY